MKYLLLTLGVFSLSSLSFAKELSETGRAVLTKIRALKEEEKHLVASITDEEQKDLVEELLDKEDEKEDNHTIAKLENEDKEVEEKEEAHPREKRAARHRGRAAAPSIRRLKAHRRRAHAARRRANLRRARRNHRIKKIRAIQRRRG